MGTKNVNLVSVFITLLTIELVACDLNLLLLHTNDIHARFEETSATSGICQKKGSCFGGFARIISAVKDIRKAQEGKRDIIFLNAGDNFQGSPYYTIFKWSVVADFIDRLGFDVMALGNHEFDDGPKGLALYLKNISTVSVAANIDVSDEPSLISSKLVPYKILEVNNVKIAVIGYLTPSTKSVANPGNVKFHDEVKSIKEQIKHIKEIEDVKIFIALGHSGYNVDMKIAEQVSDIDVVVGGHTNTFLYNGEAPDREKPIDSYPKIITQKSGKRVPVVQAYAFTKYLGYLELDFDDDGNLTKFAGNPILLNNDYKQDEAFLKALEPWKTRLETITTKVIGVTMVFLDAHNRACKLHECNLGNAIADAMIESNMKMFNWSNSGWTDAPIAFIQGGGIRSSIDASHSGGNVTYGDVLTVLPFEDHLMKGIIKGKYLKDAFEHAVHRYEKTHIQQVGEFLQVSGVRVKYNIKNPVGNRVSSLRLRCGACNVPVYEDLDEEKDYTIITSKFLADGGDDYTMLKKNLRNVVDLLITDTDSFGGYIHARSPIYPYVTNRITFTARKYDESGNPMPDIGFEPSDASSIESGLSLLFTTTLLILVIPTMFI